MEPNRISATHDVSTADEATRDMYSRLACAFPSGMFASVLRAEEGTIFAPLPVAQRVGGTCEDRDEEFGWDGYSFSGSEDAGHDETHTPPASPRPPPSARATREGDVLQRLVE